MYSVGPFDIVDGIQVDFHKGAYVHAMGFAKIQLVAHALVIGGVKLRKVFRTVIEIISHSGAEGESSEKNLEIGRGSQMG